MMCECVNVCVQVGGVHVHACECVVHDGGVRACEAGVHALRCLHRVCALLLPRCARPLSLDDATCALPCRACARLLLLTASRVRWPYRARARLPLLTACVCHDF